MAYHSPRKVTHGDIITAADWNALVSGVEHAHQVIETQKTPEPTPPSMLALAGVAAAASVSQKPISRRALLGLWRGK